MLLGVVKLCQHFTACFLEELYRIHSTIVYNNMYSLSVWFWCESFSLSLRNMEKLGTM